MQHTVLKLSAVHAVILYACIALHPAVQQSQLRGRQAGAEAA